LNFLPSASGRAVLAYGGADEARRGAFAARARVKVTLFGSLAFTGKGHATDRAIILGLAGQIPETVDSDHAETVLDDAATRHRLLLAGRRAIDFDPQGRHRFRLRLDAAASSQHDDLRRLRCERRVAERGDLALDRRRVHRSRRRDARGAGERRSRIPTRSATRPSCLLEARDGGLTIAELVWANETAVSGPRPRSRRGCSASSAPCSPRSIAACAGGVLPGGLKVRRRAKAIFDRLTARLNAHAAHEIAGLCRGLRDGGQRRERRGRARRHGADQRRGGRHSGGDALLPRSLFEASTEACDLSC
jgi:L-serine dehydratase